MISDSLIKKYNIAAPRYTSYPTVPYWDAGSWDKESWLNTVRKAYKESCTEGISIYIHLPFCENLCTYCGCTTRITKNHKVEEPYIMAVVKEWKMYCKELECKPRIREIHLGGGTPTFFSPENLEKLISGILEYAEIVDGSDFSFEAHPANTTAAHLQILYRYGFRRVSIGVQTLDPTVQQIINRKQSIEQVERVTTEARAIGYTSVNFDLIYGLPLQNHESIKDTFSRVIKLMPDRIAYYSYAHVPWIKPGQRRFTENDLPEHEEKRKLYELGRKLLQQEGYYDVGMDHFALKSDSLYKALQTNHLHRNFMGYTHQYTKLSIGLGISSISDSWYAFAQNVKLVEVYLKEIANDSFPLIKGHILTDEDLMVRRNILDIMCKGATAFNSQHPLFNDILPRLTPLEADGLIQFKENYLVVPEKGRPFLRNICMCFDQRLWQNEPESQIFSSTI